MYCSYQYLLIDQKKNVATPTVTPTNFKNRKYARGYFGNY